jgi:TonB-linked SusC/RagA family outer membrane protein
VLHAQNADDSYDRRPRFLLASANLSAPLARADVNRAPVLGTRISVDLQDVTLEQALKAIASQSGFQLAYSTTVVALDRTVRLIARDITVAAALTEVLLGADVDVVFLPSGRAMLVKRPPPILVGTITGRVTDSAAHAPVVAAQVTVVGTRLGGLSDESGLFRITGVRAGESEVSVKRLGFIQASRRIQLRDGETATVDFALARAPTQLEAVTTTVTGAQRALELGHAVAMVTADSVIKRLPVSNISDLLTSRVPSAMVSSANGLTGQVSKIRIRGINSFSVANDPLVIVDGARIEATPGMASRLGDLSTQEIESLDIVKGPAAATLYGTDAANGVIVIRTKRGQAGKTRWDMTGEKGSLVQDTGPYPTTMYGWGHLTNGQPARCLLFQIAQGACVQDSISYYNPLRDPQQTPVGRGHREQGLLQVSGGAGQFRYLVSGGLEQELGWMKMPLAEQARLKRERGVTSLPDEQVRPNYLRKVNLRGNLSTDLGPNADLSLSNGVVIHNFRNANGGSIFSGGYYSPGFKDSTYGGYGLVTRVGDVLSVRDAQGVVRYMSSLSGNYRPNNWLATRSTIGLDYSHILTDSLQRRGEGPSGLLRTGYRSQGENTIAQYSVDIGATATIPVPRIANLTSRTSIGAQYNRRTQGITFLTGTGLPPGSETVAGAATIGGSEGHALSVVVGSFVEQQLGWRERLFVTAAVRADGASTFGKDLHTTTYPKFSVSWLASEEPFFPNIPGLESLRLRAAHGSSGVQPLSTAGLSTVSLVTGSINNLPANAALPGAVGNARVRPERQTEREFGFDVEAFRRRARAEVTAYYRKSTDALVEAPFAASVGARSRYGNIGSVSNRGVEALVNARVLERDRIAFDLTFTGSYNRNRLESVGPDAPPGFFANYTFFGARHRVGYPLYGGWQKRILSYSANPDGIVTQSLVQVADTEAYIGPTAPTKQVTLSGALSLWRDLVRLSAMVDGRGGFTRLDYVGWVRCALFFNCAGAVDRTASPKEQAAVQAYLKGNTNVGFWSSGSYTRLREVSASARLPSGILRYSRAKEGTLTFAGRNLWYWSKWTGGDPEVSSIVTGGRVPSVLIGLVPTSSLNTASDLEVTPPTPPSPRLFIARLSLAY